MGQPEEKQEAGPLHIGFISYITFHRTDTPRSVRTVCSASGKHYAFAVGDREAAQIVRSVNKLADTEAVLALAADHVENIDRQVKHLEADAIMANLTTQSAIDYVNQIRSITSQMLAEIKEGLL